MMHPKAYARICNHRINPVLAARSIQAGGRQGGRERCRWCRLAFSANLHQGTSLETSGLGGFKSSQQTALWLVAVPTANTRPGGRRRPTFN